jgi:hypothetical protein
MPLSVSAPFRFCPFPFMPLSGLIENADYAGFLYVNLRAPIQGCPMAFLLSIFADFGLMEELMAE